jgi:hypothetical protein
MEEVAQEMTQPVTVLKLAHRLQAMTRLAVTQTQQRARAAEEALGLSPGAEAQTGLLSNTGILALLPEGEDEANRQFEGAFSIVPPAGSAASDRFSIAVENQVTIPRSSAVPVVVVSFGDRVYSTSRGSVGRLAVLAENEKFRGKAVHLTYVMDPSAQRFVYGQSQTRTPTLAHPRAASVGPTEAEFLRDETMVEVCPVCALVVARRFLMEQNAAMYAEEEARVMDASHAGWSYSPWFALTEMQVREL